MSLSDDTLHKVLQQIQNKTIQSQRQLSIVRAQLASRERERKITQLTTGEIEALPKDGVKLYRGVGKMFVMEPRKVMEHSLAASEKEIVDDIATLTKKAKYLEKQFSESQSQLRDIFHSQQQG